MLPTMTGQRSVVQNSSVRSAYCPPPALVAADSAAMPGWFTAVDLGGEQAVASSRWPDRQIGTTERGSGIGPSTSTLAPVPRSCCTRRVRLSIHAGSYDVKPGNRGRHRTPPHADHDQPRVLGAQPGDDLTAPLLALGVLPVK